MRGGAVWQLVGLITRRSQVQILPPLPAFRDRRKASMEAFFDGGKSGLVEVRFSLGAEIQWYRTRGPMGPLLHLGPVPGTSPAGRVLTEQMSDKATRITTLLAPTVQSMGLELLGVEYLPAPGVSVLRLSSDLPSDA